MKKKKKKKKKKEEKINHLITLKLLGGMKFAIGKNSIVINKSQSTLKEIFEELKIKAKDSKIVNEKNVIISINGVDSSIIGGKEAIVKTGDTITIVTIIHGG